MLYMALIMLKYVYVRVEHFLNTVKCLAIIQTNNHKKLMLALGNMVVI